MDDHPDVKRLPSSAAGNRNLAIFLVAAVIFMDMMVYSIVIPVLPSYVTLIGGDASSLGVIFGLYPAMLFLFSIPMGMLSDRAGRKPVMLSGILLLAAATVIFGFSTTVPMLALERAVQGVSAAATWSAGLALLAETFGRGELGGKMGMVMSMVGLGMMAGPIAGGLLYEHLGYAPTFLLPAVLIGILAVLMLVLPIRFETPPASLNRSLLPGAGALPLLAMYAAVAIAVAATYGVLEPYMPVYLHDTFAASPVTIGIVLGGLALTGVITQPFAGRLFDRRGGVRMIAVGLILSGVIVAAAMQAGSILLVAVIISLLGVTLSFALIPVMPLIAELYCRGGRRGSEGIAYGVFNSLYSVGLAVGPLLAASLISAYSLPVILSGHAMLILIVGIAGYFLMRGEKTCITSRD